MLLTIMNWYIMHGKKTWIKIKRRKLIGIEIKDKKTINRVKTSWKSKDRLNKKNTQKEYKQEAIVNQLAYNQMKLMLLIIKNMKNLPYKDRFNPSQNMNNIESKWKYKLEKLKSKNKSFRIRKRLKNLKREINPNIDFSLNNARFNKTSNINN